MGEAWFMSTERKMYFDLLGDLRDIPVDRVQHALNEIASGTSAFGPYDEWNEWFHYLLPRMIPRSHETFVEPLLEALITACITQYPNGLDPEPYQGFRNDVLDTLGRCMMDVECWPNGILSPEVCLNKYYVCRRGLWFWFDASGPLSASMFFCLKYLAADQVKRWIESVLAIESPHWRGQVMIWLLGAHGVFSNAIKQPADFSFDDFPKMCWDWSHILSGNYSGNHDGKDEHSEFIPSENRISVLNTVSDYFTEDVFLEWLESFSSDPALEDELAQAPFQFFDLYMSKTK